jgi:hypothetical protein
MATQWLRGLLDICFPSVVQDNFFNFVKKVQPYLLLILILLSLFFRDFDAPACTKKIVGPLGSSVIINCDSAQFMQDSQNFERVLQGTTSYQDRPLYAGIASILSFVMSPIITETRSFENSRGEVIEFRLANLISFYIINLLVLLISLHLLLNTFQRLRFLTGLQVLTLTSIVFLNDIVKGFTWTPHTQVFNILLVSLALYSWVCFRTEQTAPNAIVWFLLISCLGFLYPSLLLLSVIPISRSLKYLKYSLIPIVSFLSYPILIEFLGGNYRNAAIEDFDQFVWIFDVGSMHDLGLRFESFLYQLDKPLLVSVLILLIWRVFLHSRPISGLLDRSIATFILVFTLFLLFMGFYSTRLSTPLLLTILVVFLLDLRPQVSVRNFNAILTVIFLTAFIQFFFSQGQLT